MASSSGISFSWDIHWDCNYRCPYCWWHGRWDELAPVNRYPGVEKLTGVWKRIYDKYGRVTIEIVGGEPFLYTGFTGFLSNILEYHGIGVTTNLSFDPAILKSILESGKQKSLGIGATFHPLHAEYGDFIEKAETLHRAGVLRGIYFLAWPPQVKMIPGIKEDITGRGMGFSVNTFWGDHDGKKYPDSYTDEECRIIGREIGSRGGEKFQLRPVEVLGKLCRAGHTYGTIHPDGKVLRCGGGGYDGKETVVGNIFDDNFELLPGPTPCISRSCPCNEWAFLLEKNE